MALTPEQQLFEGIQRASHVLVICHEQPSVDALCSLYALAAICKKLHKTFDAVAPGYDPRRCPSYLPRDIDIQTLLGPTRSLHLRLDVTNIRLGELLYQVNDGQLDISLIPQHGEWKTEDVRIVHGQNRYDLILAVGCPDRASLGTWSEDQSQFLFQTPIINIDHHASNEHWGHLNYVDPTVAATTELVFQWLEQERQNLLDENLATVLLAGIIANTQGFRGPNINPRTLERAARLVALGAKREDIVHALWRTHSLNALQLWGRALSRLDQFDQLPLVWTVITDNDFLETKTSADDLVGIIPELLAYAPQAKIALVIQQSGNDLHVDVLAASPYSAADIARLFGGGGDQRRATFDNKAEPSLVEATQKILEAIKQNIIV